uniref:Uncharacterized protein n=1 Tax=Octopus bimaculoides TaxID=37653 RepID=A0A0L8GPN2_OCTBM
MELSRLNFLLSHFWPNILFIWVEKFALECKINVDCKGYSTVSDWLAIFQQGNIVLKTHTRHPSFSLFLLSSLSLLFLCFSFHYLLYVYCKFSLTGWLTILTNRPKVKEKIQTAIFNGSRVFPPSPIAPPLFFYTQNLWIALW